MAENTVVELTISEGVGVITINNPPVNALTLEVRSQLKRILQEVEGNKEIRALIITGYGSKCFVAGADIKDFPKQMETGPRENATIYKEMFTFLEETPQPVIAALNGLALGGGCELALACDLRIADEKAKLGLPEVTLGLIPGLGGTQRLAKLVGPAKAKELLFTGKVISAREALDIGLINQIVPQGTVLEEALKLAKQLAKGAGVAISYAKYLVNKGIELSLEDGMEIEMQYVEKIFLTQDLQEGLEAFINKRPAVFRNC
ncbi:enoyl-CoA hydratase/carnithine racemase [Desulfosporosinus acidiphilus SJ4]|uniref:short-chain-enoyl-CoA hydratase n=1 Tax=Desulfosporosinus acidiphilus (strain DSM 22704 / JCM 16185 / SJ4) TaxID=646529 RepID=I4D670_DESAJ|nr:enoyl-CoA hydratase [Desulfosporosinus acidiphilus]AFM41294.1 enoyl-CoA hydratase/carnithine racemase [Desulfosporosinus acidiphilus SJ4]